MSNLLANSGTYLFYQLLSDVQNLPKNAKHFNPKKVFEKIKIFFKSDEFILLHLLFEEKYLFIIIKLCKMCEKHMFFKIIFPLLEELKSDNFDHQLRKAKQSKERKEEILNSFESKNKEKINKVLNLGIDTDITLMKNVCNNLNKSLIFLYTKIFEAALKIIFGQGNEKCRDFNSDFERLEKNKKFYKESFIQLFDNFIELSGIINLHADIFNVDIISLKHTKDLYQIINIINNNLQFEKNGIFKRLNKNVCYVK